MRLNKRGLSNIIATVLLILLAIAAVVIVWAFISGSITNTASQVEITNALTSSSFSLQSATETGGRINVVILRNAGGASGFTYFPILSFELDNGDIDTVNVRTADPDNTNGCNALQEFATCVYDDYSAPSDATVVKVSVYGAVADAQGNVANTNEPTDVETVTSGGPAAPACGDGTVNGNEECEGISNQACTDVGGYSGTQDCNANACTWGTCISTESCGDNLRNGQEQCDGQDIDPAYAQQCFDFETTPDCQSDCTVICL